MRARRTSHGSPDALRARAPGREARLPTGCSRSGSGSTRAGTARRRGRCPRTREARSARGRPAERRSRRARRRAPGGPTPLRRAPAARARRSRARGSRLVPRGTPRRPPGRDAPRRAPRPARACLDPRSHVGGHAVLEVLHVDAEPLCQPGDRVGGRAGLAALDLTHVLLGEACARELGLGQSRRDAQRPHAVADPAASRRRRRPVSGGRIAHPAVTQPATCLSALPRRGELHASNLGFMVKWRIAWIT